MKLDQISSPTLLLDKKRMIANIEKMTAKTERNKLNFRPHFKTAQSRAIGKIFRKNGVNAITVSSVKMAEYFAADGWDDITIAFPANVREAESIDRLSAKIKLNLLVVNVESVLSLGQGLKNPVGIFIKIDVGSERTGVSPENLSAISDLIQKIEASKQMRFRGFLAHAGHSYAARSREGILKTHESSTAILRKLKKHFSTDLPHLILSTGDTPTCSVAENWEGIDEIRPGNFVFYDLMQAQIGSCQIKDIAVALACPVVAKHAERQEVIVHGGGIHLSKDRLKIEGKNIDSKLSGLTIYGLPVLLGKHGWQSPESGNLVRSLSQEHGIISCTSSFFEKINIGDLVGILPVHSCMTVNLMDQLVSLEGEVMDLI